MRSSIEGKEWSMVTGDQRNDCRFINCRQAHGFVGQSVSCLLRL